MWLDVLQPGGVAGFGIIKGEVMGTGEGSVAGTDDIFGAKLLGPGAISMDGSETGNMEHSRAGGKKKKEILE